MSSFLLSQIAKKSYNLIYSSKTGNLYTGKAFELYEDGTKSFEGYYEDVLMNGSWTYYYSNAVTKAKGNKCSRCWKILENPCQRNNCGLKN